MLSPSKCRFLINHHDFKVGEQDVIKLKASKFILHPEWDHHSVPWDADLAIVIVENQISYSERVKPLCLNYQSISNYHGGTATVIGWGITNDLSEADEELLELKVNVVDLPTCYSTDKDLEKYVENKNTMICAGNRNRTGACVGEFYVRFLVKSKSEFNSPLG